MKGRVEETNADLIKQTGQKLPPDVLIAYNINSETYVEPQSQTRPRQKNSLLHKGSRKVKPTTNAVLNALQSDK